MPRSRSGRVVGALVLAGALVVAGLGTATADAGSWGSGHNSGGRWNTNSDPSHHHAGSRGGRDRHSDDHAAPATVYTETNAVSANAVLAYQQHSDGSTSFLDAFPTDGNGTGVALASQGAVTLSTDNQRLAAVNAGSNSVTVFSTAHDGHLNLVDSAGSGGVDPISVTINGDWVYVLNAGDTSHPANVAGLFIEGDHLVPQPSDVQPLNPTAASPEQIGFSPDGTNLVVSEKASDTVDVFAVDPNGDASPATTTTLATGTGPYGFAFTPTGMLVLSEAGFGGLGTYAITGGTLTKISEVADGQLAACWVALSSDGHNAYTSNAHSGTVSFYIVADDGTLTLNNPAIATTPGIGDTDLAVAGHDAGLDILVGDHIDTASIANDGSLGPSTPIVTGLAPGTDGLAATN